MSSPGKGLADLRVGRLETPTQGLGEGRSRRDTEGPSGRVELRARWGPWTSPPRALWGDGTAHPKQSQKPGPGWCQGSALASLFPFLGLVRRSPRLVHSFSRSGLSQPVLSILLPSWGPGHRLLPIARPPPSPGGLLPPLVRLGDSVERMHSR